MTACATSRAFPRVAVYRVPGQERPAAWRM